MKNHLQKFRTEAKLTLEELSSAAGISKSYAHGLEKDINSPGIEAAYAVAKVLGLSVYDIWPDTTKYIEETVTIRRVVRESEFRHVIMEPSAQRANHDH